MTLRPRRKLPRSTCRTAAAALAAAAVLAFLPSPTAAQQTRALIVVGLGGAPEYQRTFHTWATDLRDALVDLGVRRDHIIYLGEDNEASAGQRDGVSSVDGLTGAVTRIAGEAGPSDRVLLVLMGHGTTRGDEARFNLPGPDMTAVELGFLLESAFPTQTVAVVNTASASGPYVEALSGPGRVVLTATRSGREDNETHFGAFFVGALEGEGADLDKDGRLSLLEAFQFATREVLRHYEEQNLLMTEHALLDDDGDGEGSLEPGSDGADGAMARVFYIGTVGAATATGPTVTAVPDSVTDPALRRLYQERADIQAKIEALQLRRNQMETAAYEAQLEDLLVQLALKNREIREHGGGRP